MRKILTVVALCALGVAFAASDQPNEGKTAANPKGETKQRASDVKFDTTPLEKAIRESIRDASGKHDPHADQRLKNEGNIAKDTAQLAVSTEDLSRFTLFLAILTGLLASVAVVQLCMFWKQLGLMKEGAKDARDVAEAAKASADAAKIGADAVMASERAWVRLTFLPPGLKIESKGRVSVSASIKNAGRTPALVTDIYISGTVREHGNPLEVDFFTRDFVDPVDRRKPSGFLVSGDSISEIKSLPLRDPQRQEIMDSAKRLWVYGWVDYRDAFGRPFRSFTVRMYEPILGEGENAGGLNFIYPSGAYDIDRPRIPGEGHDWPNQRADEPTP